jgi:hypothetical protein
MAFYRISPDDLSILLLKRSILAAAKSLSFLLVASLSILSSVIRAGLWVSSDLDHRLARSYAIVTLVSNSMISGFSLTCLM